MGNSEIHPLAWWSWALVLTFAASSTRNPYLLATIASAACFVAFLCRGSGPWRNAIQYAILLAFVLLGIRFIIAIIFGAKIPGHTLVQLPMLHLPSWLSGIAVGGPVTLEKLASILREGLQVATLVIVFGAATSLTKPKQLLKSLPRALHEAGVIVIVATTFVPQLVASIRRVRSAQRLRGSNSTRSISLRRIVIPVIEDALTKSLDLAAAMESRGYGRTKRPDSKRFTMSSLFLVGGLLGIAFGLYALLIPTSFINIPWEILGLAALATMLGLWSSGRSASQTYYRPAAWTLESGAIPVLAIGTAISATETLSSKAPSLLIALTCAIFAAAPTVFVRRQS